VTGSGRQSPIVACPARGIHVARFPPEGKLIALDVVDAGKSDVLVYEPERERMSSLTFTGAARSPIWTDGKHIVFPIPDRYNKLGWIRADGMSRPEVLLGRQEKMVPVKPNCFSPDGSGWYSQPPVHKAAAISGWCRSIGAIPNIRSQASRSRCCTRLRRRKGRDIA
jgi:hypothetical protein